MPYNIQPYQSTWHSRGLSSVLGFSWSIFHNAAGSTKISRPFDITDKKISMVASKSIGTIYLTWCFRRTIVLRTIDGNIQVLVQYIYEHDAFYLSVSVIPFWSKFNTIVSNFMFEKIRLIRKSRDYVYQILLHQILSKADLFKSLKKGTMIGNTILPNLCTSFHFKS